jgi:hypothetical protein
MSELMADMRVSELVSLLGRMTEEEAEKACAALTCVLGCSARLRQSHAFQGPLTQANQQVSARSG